MRRWLLVVLSVALAVLTFAPVAAARGGDDGGFDDSGGFDDRGRHARGADDNAAASSASNTSASASPTASPSVNPSASPSASPKASLSTMASATPPVLPDTSGFPPAWILGPLAMILGGGLMAFGIVRRR
jgi:hypothetical protein